MIGKASNTLLVLLGVFGMTAVGVLLVHRSDNTPGIEWAIGFILAALSYMVVYGLTRARQR